MSKFCSSAVGVGLFATLLATGGCASSGRKNAEAFFSDLQVLNEVCTSQKAGDRVYRRVDEVQGIFRATVVNPNPDWGDQYGMESPYATLSVGADMYTNIGDPKGGSYWFVEAPPAHGSNADKPYRRNYLYVTGKLPTPWQIATSNPAPLSADGEVLGERKISAQRLLSRYAWAVEDLTTTDLRKHWIAGERIKIFDRISDEILAERVNFYRATGPGVRMSWAPGVGCDNSASNYLGGKFVAQNDALFIKYVLKPPSTRPSSEQLKQFSGE